jgi:hypothetical protein
MRHLDSSVEVHVAGVAGLWSECQAGASDVEVGEDAGLGSGDDVVVEAVVVRGAGAAAVNDGGDAGADAGSDGSPSIP